MHCFVLSCVVCLFNFIVIRLVNQSRSFDARNATSSLAPVLHLKPAPCKWRPGHPRYQLHARPDAIIHHSPSTIFKHPPPTTSFNKTPSQTLRSRLLLPFIPGNGIGPTTASSLFVIQTRSTWPTNLLSRFLGGQLPLLCPSPSCLLPSLAARRGTLLLLPRWPVPAPLVSRDQPPHLYYPPLSRPRPCCPEH